MDIDIFAGQVQRHCCTSGNCQNVLAMHDCPGKINPACLITKDGYVFPTRSSHEVQDYNPTLLCAWGGAQCIDFLANGPGTLNDAWECADFFSRPVTDVKQYGLITSMLGDPICRTLYSAQSFDKGLTAGCQVLTSHATALTRKNEHSIVHKIMHLMNWSNTLISHKCVQVNWDLIINFLKGIFPVLARSADIAMTQLMYIIIISMDNSPIILNEAGEVQLFRYQC